MGLFRTATRVAVASSVHGNIQRRQGAKWAAQDQAAQQQAAQQQALAAQQAAVAAQQAAAAIAAPAAAPAAPDMDAKIAQLTQLGQLRDAGILSDAEFEAKKAQVLAS